MWEFAKGCLLAVANYGLFYLVSVFISRWLGPSEFGDYSVAIAAAGIGAAAATLGMDRLCMKKLPVFRKERQVELGLGFIVRGSQVSLAGGLVLFLLVLAVALPLFLIRPSMEIHQPLLVGIFFIPVMGLVAFWSEVLNVNDGYVLSTGINRLLLPVCILACLYAYRAVYDHFSAREAVLAVGMSWSLCLVVIILFLRRRIPKLFWEAEPRFETRAWLSESYAFVVNTILLLAIQKSGVLVLEAVHAHENEVGVYAAAVQVSSFVIVFVMVSNRFFLPRMSAYLKEGSTATVNRILADRFRALFLIASAIGVMILIFGKVFLGWFSPEFATGYPALCVLTVAAVWQTLLAINTMVWQFMGFKNLVMKSYLAILVSACACIALASPRYGIMGAALGHAVPFLAVLVYLEVRLFRQHGISTLGLGRKSGL